METDNPVNLTRVAYYGRLFVKFGTISLVVLIVGRTFLMAALGFWTATHPPAPPPPTMGFGALPPLRFPAQATDQKPSSYQLETPTGRFPSFGDRAKVFLMPKSTPSLLADKRAKELAAYYGFVFPPAVLNARTYRWTRTTPLQATMEMDIQDNTFTMNTNFLSKPELLGQKNVPTDLNAVSAVKSYISAGQQLPDDIATSSGTVSYLKAVGGDLVPAVSFSDADFLDVSLQRSPVDDLINFFTPDQNKGIIHGIITGALDAKDAIVRMDYKYRKIDYDQVHTYPLRSVDSAWQVLQAGEGYIANKGTSDAAVIRDVQLGYYDDTEPQDYVQPIYVFTGDDGFLGYVSALDPRVIIAPASTATDSQQGNQTTN